VLFSFDSIGCVELPQQTRVRAQTARGLGSTFPFRVSYCFASNFTGLVSTWKGLKILMLPVNGRCTFLGSRHESEQTPPHPNSNELV
jgi:hypothetical protein